MCTLSAAKISSGRQICDKRRRMRFGFSGAKKKKKLFKPGNWKHARQAGADGEREDESDHTDVFRVSETHVQRTNVFICILVLLK